MGGVSCVYVLQLHECNNNNNTNVIIQHKYEIFRVVGKKRSSMHLIKFPNVFSIFFTSIRTNFAKMQEYVKYPRVSI